jgi:Ras-related protein Rab-1A
MAKYDHALKIIIIGDAGVGKSSIASMYCESKYNDQYTSTIGVDFYIKTLRIDNDNTQTKDNPQQSINIKLQIWDTAGQERYRSITSSYYKSAYAVVLVFDMTDAYSFSRLDYWIDQLRHNMSSSNYKIIILGNKCEDLNSINVDEKMIGEFKKRTNIEIFKVSAKQNINIDESFNHLIKNSINLVPVNNNSIKINQKKTELSDSCC